MGISLGVEGSLCISYPHILIRVWHLCLETSRSRDFCQFFSRLGIGIGKKVSKKSRYRYRNLVSEKVTKKSGEISKKLSVNSCQSYAKVSVSVSRPVTIFWESRYRYQKFWSRKKVSVLVPENLSRIKSLGLGIGQNFGLVTQWSSYPYIFLSSYKTFVVKGNFGNLVEDV